MKRLFVFVSLIIYAFSIDVWKDCKKSCKDVKGNRVEYLDCIIKCAENIK